MALTGELPQYSNKSIGVNVQYHIIDATWSQMSFRIGSYLFWRKLFCYNIFKKAIGLNVGLQFEWDNKKANINKQKHGVTFEEATTAFADEFSITIDDPLHSDDEDRMILIGLSKQFNILVVVHTERGDILRIISARKASKQEQKFYKEH